MVIYVAKDGRVARYAVYGSAETQACASCLEKVKAIRGYGEPVRCYHASVQGKTRR